MNVLIINGSPKGEKSNSLQLSNAFVQGIGETVATTVHKLNLSSMNISACKGCFVCWNKTPGQCCIKDDMRKTIEEILWADIVIWSFPLYYFNVPGLLKNMIDRQLPMALPFMIDREDGCGNGSHPSRYNMSGKKHVLISTCGFYSAEKNYESVTDMFDHICGVNNYETIFCGQGELFRVPELKARTAEYLNVVKTAGREYISGAITEATRSELKKLLFDKETFEAMADASWGIDKETGENEDSSLTFTKQMSNLYKKENYDGKDRVLEICYTDLDKTYQLMLGKDGCKVVTDGSLIATTRIETPWDVWTAISRGELEGAGALAAGKYRVSGELELMMHWDKYFGATGSSKQEINKDPDSLKNKDIGKDKKPPVMTTMLIAWITFWVAVSFDTHIGSIITIAVCAMLPIIFVKHEINIFDRISMGMVGLLSAFAGITNLSTQALVAGYICFGLLWLVSCAFKYPLCAGYVKYNFGGDAALRNPIFMKTNYILAISWGILYVLIGIWSAVLLSLDKVIILQIFNNTCTLLMGAFTAWFQDWYPKKMMTGTKKAY